MTSRVEHLAEGVTLYLGECGVVLADIAANSIDACVTDPPYELKFMGKGWDGTGIAFDQEIWRRVLRVLKPGAHLLAFGGTRTYHRMACAIEDAGFEIRDCVQWIYGSGFPKSLDVSKAIDKAARGFPQGSADPTSLNHGKYKGGCSDENPNGRGFGAGPGQFMREAGTAGARNLTEAVWSGFGTALKPACEPIVLARKPLSEGTVAANVLKWGTGALNIDGCRVPVSDADLRDVGRMINRNIRAEDNVTSYAMNAVNNEVVTVVRAEGRWPANVVHDGSDEVVATFPDAPGQQRALNGGEESKAEIYGKYGPKLACEPRYDFGSAARFFYTAKADADDRLGSKHPTVKPIDLMQWLVRLVGRKGALILDPFAGTGTTGEAAFREGMRAVLIEREAEYQEDIRRRMRLAMAGPDERARESIKQRMKGKPVDLGPLFGGAT